MAEVTMNRRAALGYPKTVCEVVYQTFSWTAERVSRPAGAEWRRALKVADEVYHRRRSPTLPGVLHYHATVRAARMVQGAHARGAHRSPRVLPIIPGMRHRAVLFVCTGNICRSPTAEAVLRHLAKEEGIELHIQSAGIGDWHVGHPPDERAQKHAKTRGYDLSGLRARQVSARDFEEFDLILAMDRGHLRSLERMAPREHRHKIRLFVAGSDVPDPYYGGPESFERVLDLVEARCRDLLQDLKRITSS